MFVKTIWFKNVPIALFPMIWRIFFDEFQNPASELWRFQQQQLNNIKANLCFVSLLRSNSLILKVAICIRKEN